MGILHRRSKKNPTAGGNNSWNSKMRPIKISDTRATTSGNKSAHQTTSRGKQPRENRTIARERSRGGIEGSLCWWMGKDTEEDNVHAPDRVLEIGIVEGLV